MYRGESHIRDPPASSSMSAGIKDVSHNYPAEKVFVVVVICLFLFFYEIGFLCITALAVLELAL